MLGPQTTPRRMSEHGSSMIRGTVAFLARDGGSATFTDCAVRAGFHGWRRSCSIVGRLVAVEASAPSTVGELDVLGGGGDAKVGSLAALTTLPWKKLT